MKAMKDEELVCGFDGIMLMDGYDDCLAGVVERADQKPIACYDMEKVLSRLVRDGMSRDEAKEYFQFNQIGAWVGDLTPCFLTEREG